VKSYMIVLISSWVFTFANKNPVLMKLFQFKTSLHLHYFETKPLINITAN